MKIKLGLSEENIRDLSKDDYIKKMAEVNYLRKLERIQIKEGFLEALQDILEAL